MVKKIYINVNKSFVFIRSLNQIINRKMDRANDRKIFILNENYL